MRLRRRVPLLLALPTLALTAPAGWIEVTSLPGTRLAVSSVNGGRASDNPFYGAQNLTDGGRNMVNGIPYTTWLSGHAGSHWIRVSFPHPVEIESVILEFPDPTLALRRPREFALDLEIRGPDHAAEVNKLPSAPVTGFRTFYPLRAPVERVTALTAVFPGPALVEVAEIEVRGR